MILIRQLAFFVLLSLPIAAVLFTTWRERTKDSARNLPPFDELRRRPAGESVRLKVEELGEELDVWLMTLLTVPLAFALALSLQPTVGATTIAFYFLTVAVGAGAAHRKIRPLVELRRRYRLGFHGERFVAEELNLLMADQCQVFHDVPFEKYNIDHVIVGSRGVFIVETKARRKPVSPDGTKHFAVSFDGDALVFPHGKSSAAPAQIRRNVESFSKWISSATGESISASGILTIPGWWVEPSPPSDILVLNPKQIRGAVLAQSRTLLSPAQIQRVCHQLEEKCRLSIGAT